MQNMSNDNELIERFAADRSEDAFTELVARHLDLVYGAALRQTREAELARDVAQQVFAVFARKASGLRSHGSLVGWLHRTTYLTSKKALRTEARRRSREKTAAAMIELNQTPSNPEWDQVSPLLDDAVEQLNDADRTAILTRYFERRPLAEVGTTLGISEDAARKRVSRAVEKLRDLLEQRGVTISATGLAAALSGNLANSAPAGLVAAVSTQAIVSAGGIGAFISQLSLTAKIAMGAGAVGVVAALLTLAGPTPEPETTTAQPIPPATSPAVSDASAITAALVEGTDSQTQIAAQQSTPGATEFEPAPMLRLTVLDKATGEPIPNAPVERFSRRNDGTHRLERHVVHTDSEGVCEFTWPEHDSYLIQVTTQIEGYADTRLAWRLDQGAQVPTVYTLAIEKAAPIGGWVVDEEGRGISGAKIGFNHQDVLRSTVGPESHEFEYITTTSDANGRWEINRIASDMVPQIYGSAQHPSFVRSSYHPRSNNAPSYELLLEKELVFELSRGITIAGTVFDDQDNPVAGAAGNSGRRETTTGTDGSFRLEACDPRHKYVSAEADGFSPSTVGFESDESIVTVSIRLKKGRDLMIRVYDVDGLPVAGANVWYDSLHVMRTATTHGTAPIRPAVEFNGKTDRYGELVWNDAPMGQLQFDVARDGYMRFNEATVSDSATELIVDLKPALTIRGTVTDAETGSVIPRFTIISGWPTRAIPQAGITSRPNWSSLERHWLTFEGGDYEHRFEESLVHGLDENPGYILKFEADGYESFISRTFNEDEVNVTLDVIMNPQTVTEITILGLDRQPLPDADVALAGPSAPVKLGEGGFVISNPDSSMVLRSRTDEGGNIQISKDPVYTDLVAIHASGYAHISLEAALSEPLIRLQSWSALDGILLRNGEPAVGEKLGVRFARGRHDSPIQLDMFKFIVETDQIGRFSFPQLPPEQIEVLSYSEHIDPRHGLTKSLGPIPNGRIELQPGVTSEIELEFGAPFEGSPATPR